jgi:hypothetical protein
VERSRALFATAAAVGLGLVAGLAATLLAPTSSVAEETYVVVRSGAPVADAGTAAATVRAIARADVVVTNVATALRMAPSTVRARVVVDLAEDTDAVRVRGTAPSATDAVQLVQQYGDVLAQLVAVRFASLRLQAFDPPHAVGRTDRHLWRNLGAGGSAGLLFVAVLLAIGSSRRVGPPLVARTPEPDPEPAREQEQTPVPEPDADPERGPEPGPEQEVRPDLETAPSPPEPVAPRRPWRDVGAVRERVERARADRPERAVEWDAYLAQLEPHAVAGVLPPSFDAIAEDVFGDLF